MISLLILLTKLFFILAVIASLAVIFILNKYIHGVLIFVSAIAVTYIGMILSDSENVLYQILYCEVILLLSILILIKAYKSIVHMLDSKN